MKIQEKIKDDHSREPGPWRFWIDVGGTFTDLCAVSPEGNHHYLKVLSSGLTKGTIVEFSGSRTLICANLGNAPDHFWRGVELRLVDAAGKTVATHEIEGSLDFGAQQKLFVTSEISPEHRTTIRSLELAPATHAPIVAIRRLTGTPFDQPLVDCDVQLGTTRGTNALLTRSGAKVGLVTALGYADMLAIGDQARPELFELAITKPQPLYHVAREIEQRVLANGQVDVAIKEDNVRSVLAEMKDSGVTALAVCLMHSFRFPEAEKRVGRIAAELGFSEVRLSHQVSPLIKIVPRAQTTVLDAYLNPVIGRYLDEIEAELSTDSNLHLMTSAGGLVARDQFSGKDSVLSGPAGGVVGAARIGEQIGHDKVIGFDMGGTSTDVSRFCDAFEVDYESTKAGVKIMTPMLAVETVAAGGGSICWFDGVRLHVGPDSAGADPGPCCYGRGGALTVTDLNLFLGRIQPALFPFPLDGAAVELKLDQLCHQLQMAGFDYTPSQLAIGFLEIANHNMASAIERVSVAKGYDPRQYTLMSFGGAGSQHCCAVADKLNMTTVIDHPQSSMLSALGISMADFKSHCVESVLQPVMEVQQTSIDDSFSRLEQIASEKLNHVDHASGSSVQLIRKLELRYEKTASALVVETGDVGTGLELFAQQHQQFFGYTQDRVVELVAVRVEAVIQGLRRTPIQWRSDAGAQPKTPDSVEGVMPFYQRDKLLDGDLVVGPALIADSFSTTIVDRGWRALVGPETVLMMQRSAEQATSVLRSEKWERPDPVELEIFNRCFSTIASQMGLCLQKTSVSVNVKERLDFSCAIFTSDGDLVVNAPHIPVHLGAMSATVRAVIEQNAEVNNGDVYITNDPYNGGSHLPDVTVVSPVFIDDETLAFWVASRSHHAEIGGKTPGSMPPDARSLAEEGVLIANLKLVDQGSPKFDVLEGLLSNHAYPSRNVAENVADVRAQIAANQIGIVELKKLVDQHGDQKVFDYMGFIQQAAAMLVRQAIDDLPDGVHNFVDRLDNGATIRVAVSVEGEELEIDFTGTDSVLEGNQNANPAIVRSAIMYVLRLLIDSDIPLNQGVMSPVRVTIPLGCFLNPVAGNSPQESPAIVGGNVETSQRLVDVLIGALGIAAASQGTMNNWLMGDDSFGYYETVGGGSGATADRDGADAVHVHMTNTRLTDPEILETRYPVVLREFSIRRNSGGAGARRGGDGMVRELEFSQTLELSLLTNRRNCQPWGACGGADGKAGRNLLVSPDGTPRVLEGVVQVKVQQGDLLRLETPGGGGYGSAEEGASG